MEQIRMTKPIVSLSLITQLLSKLYLQMKYKDLNKNLRGFNVKYSYDI